MADNERPRATYSDPFERDTRRAPREACDRRRHTHRATRQPVAQPPRARQSTQRALPLKAGLEAEKAETKSAHPTGTTATAHPPKGPRNPGKPPVHGSNAARPRTGPRSSTPSAIKKEEAEADEDKPDVEMADTRQKPDDMDDDEWEMLKVMGFGGFKSTKNTKVPGNDKNFGVRKDKQLQARQYMNRQGGFNRPLSPSRM
ncbi:unnamed protein product [Alternaria alternata]